MCTVIRTFTIIVALSKWTDKTIQQYTMGIIMVQLTAESLVRPALWFVSKSSHEEEDENCSNMVIYAQGQNCQVTLDAGKLSIQYQYSLFNAECS
jgi:precorrin-4 methylase